MEPCSACILGNNNPPVTLCKCVDNAELLAITVVPDAAPADSLFDDVEVIDLFRPFCCLRLCFDRGDGEFVSSPAAAEVPPTPPPPPLLLLPPPRSLSPPALLRFCWAAWRFCWFCWCCCNLTMRMERCVVVIRCSFKLLQSSSGDVWCDSSSSSMCGNPAAPDCCCASLW